MGEREEGGERGGPELAYYNMEIQHGKGEGGSEGYHQMHGSLCFFSAGRRSWVLPFSGTPSIPVGIQGKVKVADVTWSDDNKSLLRSYPPPV